MVQRAYGPVNPSVTTGDELSIELEEFWDTFRSANSGPAAPPYATTGTLWLKVPTSGTRTLMMRNASQDVPLVEFNGSNAQLHPTLIALPIGGIIMWGQSLSAIPTGFVTCDGKTHNRSDGNGTITSPDLRGRFPLGAYVSSNNVGQTGGSSNSVVQTTEPGGAISGRRTNDAGSHTHGSGRTSGHTLTVSQIPAHTHYIPHIHNETENFDPDARFSVSIQRQSTNTFFGAPTKSAGGGGSHSHGISTGGSHDHYINSVPAHTHEFKADLPPWMLIGFIMRI